MFPQYSSFGFWLLQAVVGAIFIVHGIPKLKNPSGIAATLHAPKFVGFLQGLVEFLGGLALILSFTLPMVLLQWVSLVFAVIMLGAIYFKVFKWKTGFFSHTGTGWEFDLLLLAVFVMILTR